MMPKKCSLAVLGMAFASAEAFAIPPNTYMDVAVDSFVDGSQILTFDDLFVTQGANLGGGRFAVPSQLTLLASATRELEAPGDGPGELDEVGELFDYVFRDTTDDKIVFGTRVSLFPTVEGATNEFEINFVYRSGFTGYETSAAWTFLSATDLRLYSVARSRTDFDGVTSDPDLITMQSDVNVSERNPISGLFLVKTDAASYALANNAIEVYQAGEEDQLPTRLFTPGFVPAPIPEPSTYALLLGGLGLLGFAARRRSRA